MEEISLQIDLNDTELSKVKRNILYANLEFWMTKLPATLRNLPIIHLAIPGKFENSPIQRIHFNNINLK